MKFNFENVKFLEIVFENCESIIISYERINKILIGELEKLSGEIFEKEHFNYYKTNYINLEISYKTEDELVYIEKDDDYPLGMFTNNPTSNNIIDRPNILGRVLMHNDITSIYLLDKNKKILNMTYVPWSKESEDFNMYMSLKNEDMLIKVEIMK